MSPFSRVPATLFNHLPKRKVTGEGGLITGTNPVTFTTSDPLRLWIVQVCIIILTVQLLSLCLRRLRQPKVIAEMLGGILLGPTAFGRIPGFTERIFPPVSLPYLSLVADIGLCLFLFLVGLETDTNLVKRNARMSVIVSLAGIAVPFGLGSILSIPLYHHFIDPSVCFTHFMLFTGIAYSITAFPVLCRVLTELKLLDTHVGVVVLSAGVGNDIVGWTLLALSIALVNAGSGLSALYILLVCIAFTIFLLFPVKVSMRWLARKTGSMENGPSVFYMTLVMILVLACAFFTDSVGVNAIFGAFLTGLIIPREGGLAIALVEKLEDMVSIIFLPLYFTLSGLHTNLGLLDNGITWAFTIAIIVLSFFGKFCGCAIASKTAGYGWRESSTVGALMSCKGLVEIIVLNVGLHAGILSQRVFSMFVLEALVLTSVTMPLVSILYPPERRVLVTENAPSVRGNEDGRHDDKASVVNEEQPWRHRFTVVLDTLDHIPSAMALTQLVLPPCNTPLDATSTTTVTDVRVPDNKAKMPDVRVDALQLIELSDRTSAMMKSSVADNVDPVLSIFRMFGELDELAVTMSHVVVPYDDFAQSVAEHAQRHASHLVLLSWVPSLANAPAVVDRGDTSVAGFKVAPKTVVTKSDHNPFEVLFGSGSMADASPSTAYCRFVHDVFAQSKTDVALFVDTSDRSSGTRARGSAHVFLPFFGGPDDRLALEFVVQLCLNPRMTATVVRIVKRKDAAEGRGVLTPERRSTAGPIEDKQELYLNRPTEPALCVQGPSATSTKTSDMIHDQPTTQTRLQSETADNVAWCKYAMPCSSTHAHSDTHPALRRALGRIHFSDVHTATPVHTTIRHASTIRETWPRLVIVTGRSRRHARTSHHAEMQRLAETHPSSGGQEGMRRTIGDLGAAMVMSGSAGAVVVVQAANVAVD